MFSVSYRTWSETTTTATPVYDEDIMEGTDPTESYDYEEEEYDEDFDEDYEEEIDDLMDDGDTTLISSSDHGHHHHAVEDNTTDDAEESNDPIQSAALVGGRFDDIDNDLNDQEHSGSKAERDLSQKSLDVKFQSVVKHSVSAVITWKEPCEDGAGYSR